MSVLGPGAYGDPEQPWLTREEFDAQHEAAGDEDVPAPVIDPVADVAPAPTQDES